MVFPLKKWSLSSDYRSIQNESKSPVFLRYPARLAVASVRGGPGSCSSAVMPADRNGARGAFRKAFRLDAETAVEAGAEILPGNCRRQFHHLPRIEMFAQAVEQLLRYLGRRPRHGHGITQDPLFQLGESRAILEVGQMGNLLLTDALPSAHGRVDVDSERATDERSRLKAGEPFQLLRHGVRSRLPALHLTHGPEQPQVMGRDLDG